MTEAEGTAIMQAFTEKVSDKRPMIVLSKILAKIVKTGGV